MSIVFNERKYAEEVERKKIRTTYNAIKDGTLLAKLYLERGLSEREIIELLNEKYSIYDEKHLSRTKPFNIQKMLNQAKSNPKLRESSVEFTSKELEFIHNIGDISIEKTFFALLCIYKFYGGRFYASDKEILDIANVSYGGKTCKKVFGYLIRNKHFTLQERPLPNNKTRRELYYDVSKQVLDLYNPDESVLRIEDFKNLSYYYLMYFDIGEYLFCESCGCIEQRKNNFQKYCKECAEWRKRNCKNENA